MTAIADLEMLHRRIHPAQMQDGRVSTAAFSDPEMSVDRARMRTAQESLQKHAGYGLAGFTAGFARGVKDPQEVLPSPSLFNPSHALVKGKKSKATRREFALGSSLVVRPAAPVEPASQASNAQSHAAAELSPPAGD